MIVPVPPGKRLTQTVAEAFRPADNPYALYAPDEAIGVLHAATLVVNFEVDINPLPLHNPWAVSAWPGGYPLHVPAEKFLADFPKMASPEQVAAARGYTLDGRVLEPATTQPDREVPGWVQRYRDFLKYQQDRYGKIIIRNLTAPPF